MILNSLQYLCADKTDFFLNHILVVGFDQPAAKSFYSDVDGFVNSAKTTVTHLIQLK